MPKNADLKKQLAALLAALGDDGDEEDDPPAEQNDITATLKAVKEAMSAQKKENEQLRQMVVSSMSGVKADDLSDPFFDTRVTEALPMTWKEYYDQAAASSNLPALKAIAEARQAFAAKLTEQEQSDGGKDTPATQEPSVRTVPSGTQARQAPPAEKGKKALSDEDLNRNLLAALQEPTTAGFQSRLSSIVGDKQAA